MCPTGAKNAREDPAGALRSIEVQMAHRLNCKSDRRTLSAGFSPARAHKALSLGNQRACELPLKLKKVLYWPDWG